MHLWVFLSNKARTIRRMCNFPKETRSAWLHAPPHPRPSLRERSGGVGVGRGGTVRHASGTAGDQAMPCHACHAAARACSDMARCSASQVPHQMIPLHPLPSCCGTPWPRLTCTLDWAALRKNSYCFRVLACPCWPPRGLPYRSAGSREGIGADSYTQSPDLPHAFAGANVLEGMGC